jgi:YggT family protein
MLFIQIINLIFNFFYILILARVIFSWIQVDPYHPTWGPILRFVYQMTEPIMAPVRNVMPSMGGLDLSPIIVLFGIDILRRILISALV